MRRALESSRFWLTLQGGLTAVGLSEYGADPRLAFWLMVAATVCGAFGTALAVPPAKQRKRKGSSDGRPIDP